MIPSNTDTTQERRIDDQFPKRIDQCHVERREAAYAVEKFVEYQEANWL